MGRSQPGSVSTSPRDISSWDTPIKLAATRVPGSALIHLALVRLNASNPGVFARDGQLDILSYVQVPVYKGACHHGAESRNGEGAVYGQAWASEIALGRYILQQRLYRGYEFGQPFARLGRDGDDLRPFEDSAFERVLYVGGHELDPLLVNEVALGERNQAPGYLEKVQNGEVFARLRHHRLVRGDYEHGEINSPDTGEHIVHEPLVPGNVNDAYLVAAW